MTRSDAMARNLPDVRADRTLDLTQFRQDIRQQMRTRRGEHPLIAKHLSTLNAEHMHGMLVVELVDLAPVRLGESLPALLLDEDAMAQPIGLIHRVKIMMFVFGGYDMNH